MAAVVGVVLAGSAALWLLRPQHFPPSLVATAPMPVASAPAVQISTATETEINEHAPTSLTVFRFADNPRILVLDFASLHEQGKMLNRVAAFVEKAGLPHDRVLTDGELDAAIRAQGDTVETFYLGHDYAAASLARFFALADSEQIMLDPAEQWLRALLQQEGWFASGVAAGLISLPAAGSDPRITASARAAILRHELSHGEFFSNPEYAEYVYKFWLTELTEDERGAVRDFLAKEGYDARVEELMFNEMQAYLMFTRDPTFFTPDMAAMTHERLATLQARFLAGMPAGWLRNVLASYQSAALAR
ncbi:MAG TPA: hypothetical protein VKI44_30350 [Acetobacteraceae bacterium]|nr:hypothetical protein [Acetobacteraceae bacterium]